MRRRASAYTLVEILVWMAVLVVLMSLVSGFLVSVIDSTRRSRAALEGATVRISVLERLGVDVRCSSRILAEHAGRKSDTGTLILEKPAAERILYRFEEGILYRETKTAGATTKVPVGKLAGLSFSYDRGGPAASRWVEAEIPGAGLTGCRARFYLLEPEVRP